MSMSIGPGPGMPNIEIGALRDLSSRDWSGARTFVIRRRRGEAWDAVARLNDPKQAADWIDEAVARGEGDLEDYSLEVISDSFRARHRWTRVLLTAVVGALVVVVSLVFITSSSSSGRCCPRGCQTLGLWCGLGLVPFDGPQPAPTVGAV